MRETALGWSVLIASCVVVGAALASRIGYVPMWDGRIYADCITKLATPGAALADLRCAEHATHAYMLYAALVQRLSAESYAPMLLSTAALYAAAVVAFYRAVEAAFPSTEHRLDRALLTSGFIVQPAILASVVQPGIDLPLVPAFLWCAVFALRRRWLPMILVGTAMVFTKETGVILYAILVGTYVLCFAFLEPHRGRPRLPQLAKLMPLALPLAAFAVYVAYRLLIAKESAIWTATPTNASLASQFLTPRIDRRLAASLVVMGVLNFGWVPTSFIVADSLRWLARRWRRRPVPAVPGGDSAAVRFLFVLTVTTGLALTRLAPYTNVRYALALIALLPLPFFAALIRLRIPSGYRRAIIAAWVVALSASLARTFDPISRAVFGTFAFGEHRLLRMTHLTGECCGAGRDQLVYNLQFTAFHDALDDALATLVDGHSTALFIPTDMFWFAVGPVDIATNRRTLRRSGTIVPRVLEPDSLRAGPPPARAWYLELPNGDGAAARGVLAGTYTLNPAMAFGRSGYILSAYPLSLRDGPR